MRKRLFTKKNILIIVVLLFVFSAFGVNTSAQEGQKSILSTLAGRTKTCPYVRDRLYMPFSNINTDFVVFKNILDLHTVPREAVIDGRVTPVSCLRIAGSTDRFIFMLFRIFIGAASVLAVIYIAVAGIAMITEQANIQKRIKAKDMLKHALIGLLLSVGAWVLLYTVNRKLVEFSIDETLRNTGFEQTISAGRNQSASITVKSNKEKDELLDPNNLAGLNPESTRTVPGAVDPRTSSIQFTSNGYLITTRDGISYVEKGYAPITVDGKTFYEGTATTFGGPNDINKNSYKKLAIDDSMREIDLDPENDEYISARWNYSMVGKESLKDYDVEIVNLDTGDSHILQPRNGIAVKDWGPHPDANSDADFDASNAALRSINAADGTRIGVRLLPKN